MNAAGGHLGTAKPIHDSLETNRPDIHYLRIVGVRLRRPGPRAMPAGATWRCLSQQNRPMALLLNAPKALFAEPELSKHIHNH
jgi:hypothetical protein